MSPNETEMTHMGMTHGEMYPDAQAEPTSPGDWKDQMTYPCLNLDGKQAEMMGAPDLKSGEYVRQTVVWKVARREEKDVNGKKSYSLALDLVKGSDLSPVDEKDVGVDEKTEPADDEGEEASPGLAFILAGHKGY